MKARRGKLAVNCPGQTACPDFGQPGFLCCAIPAHIDCLPPKANWVHAQIQSHARIRPNVFLSPRRDLSCADYTRPTVGHVSRAFTKPQPFYCRLYWLHAAVMLLPSNLLALPLYLGAGVWGSLCTFILLFIPLFSSLFQVDYSV